MPGPLIPVSQDDEEDVQQPSSPITQRSAPDATASQDQGQSAVQSTVSPTPTAPQAPAFDQDKYQQLEQQVQQARQPINPNDPSVKPKWYDRVAGALVGFGAGYKGGPAEGVAIGSAVTNRRYNQAEAQHEEQQKAAEGAMSDFENQNQMAQRNFATQSQAYENQLSGQRIQNEQNNANREFQRNTQNDQRTQANSDRDYERQVENDQWSHGNADRQFAQTQKNSDRSYGLEKQRVGIESSREKREEQDDNLRNGQSAASQRLARQDAIKLDQARQKNYDILENGDGKGNAGYRQQLKDLQDPNAVNPQTNKKYTPQERQDAINQLNQDHTAAKQKIEDDYASQMQTLGAPVNRVVYDSNGNAVGENGQQAAQQPTAPNSPAQQQPTQQVVTQQTKTPVKVGDEVSVGGRRARVTGINPKTGKPQVSYIQG